MNESQQVQAVDKSTERLPFLINRIAQLLPWFRIVFGLVGLISPRLLSRWYGLDVSRQDSTVVVLRYACIRAIGLGAGQLVAPAEHQKEWKRVTILVDTLDTTMLSHAAITGELSIKSAAVMLSGTTLGMVSGILSYLTTEED